MAKKRRRYLRYKRAWKSSAKDNHHLFFIKKAWSQGVYAKLRTHHYCMVMIPKNTLHMYIHKYVLEVPVPGITAAEEALKQLKMLDSAGVLHDDDPIEKRLRLLAALFDCVAQPTANALYKQLDIVYRFYERPP